MDRNQKILLAGVFIIGVLAMPAIADFVQTTIVFSVDTTISFTVWTLGGGGGGNQTTSSTSANTKYTESLFFNTSSQYAEVVNPCANADYATDCQAGPNAPAYRIRNTGNVNISVLMKLNTALTNAQLCGNSTAPSGCATGVIAACAMGNLNNSIWFNVTADIGTNAPCYDANVTLYGNFSGATVGTPQSKVLTLNSTKAGA